MDKQQAKSVWFQIRRIISSDVGRAWIVTTALLLLPGACRAEDGAALMQKMIDTYQHLQSYSSLTREDQRLIVNNQVSRNSSYLITLRYKRPNKLLLKIEKPGHGDTRSVYSDGKNLTIYTFPSKRYSVGSTAPTLSAMQPLMKQRAHIEGTLDPLFFLSNPRLLPEVTALRSLENKTIDNHPCYVVSGMVPATVPAEPKRATGPAHKPDLHRTGTTRWIWYIDQKTFLLDQIEMRTDPIFVEVKGPIGPKNGKGALKNGNRPQQGGNGPQRGALVVTLHYTISQSQPNPALSDDLFHFTAPPGAILQNDVITGQKQSGQ